MTTWSQCNVHMDYYSNKRLLYDNDKDYNSIKKRLRTIIK